MKRLILFSFISLIYSSSLGRSYNLNKGYSISGYIKDIPDRTIFYLIVADENGKADTVNSAATIDEHFYFRGITTSSGRLYFIKMDTSKVKLTTGRKSWTSIMLDNSQIWISGELMSWPDVKLEGSESTTDYHDFYKVMNLPIKNFNEQVKQAVADSAKIGQAKTAFKAVLLTFFRERLDSYASAYQIVKSSIFGWNEKKKLYNSLSLQVQDSFYGRKLKQQIANAGMQSSVVEGKRIPDFTVENKEGQAISILSLAAENKLTLIDFWASWCKPCRAEVPNLKKVYESFKSKGFNIIGISSDQNDSSWRKALEEDQTSWVNVKEGEIKVGADLFGLGSYPAYALIDDKGNIIAFDRYQAVIKAFGPKIRGEELHETVKKLLKL